MGVIPAPQQPQKAPSSTEKPVAEAPKRVDGEVLSDGLNLRPVAEQVSSWQEVTDESVDEGTRESSFRKLSMD